MLVLSRKKGEGVVVAGGTMVVRVVDIRGDKVRLGFEAPKLVPIHREEVQELVDQQLEAESGDGQGAPHTEIHGTEAAPLLTAGR